MKTLKDVVSVLEQRLAAEIGPKGGSIIGKTESGKPIYDQHNHPAHQSFTPKDHQDASQLHQYIALSNRRKPTVEAHHWAQHEKHQQMASVPPTPHVAKIVKKIEQRISTQGPRGGEIIGKTHSGKPIYDTYSHPAHKDFTPEDHNDAGNLHYQKSMKAAFVPGGEGASAHHWYEHVKHHSVKHLSPENVERWKNKQPLQFNQPRPR